MSMTPSEDEKVTRAILADTARWRDQPAAREAADIRTRLEQNRVIRTQSILTYLTADRSSWPAALDQMLREELGINTLPAAFYGRDGGAGLGNPTEANAAANPGSGW